MLEMVLGDSRRDDTYLKVIKSGDKIDPKDIEAIKLILMEEFEIQISQPQIKIEKKREEQIA
ncbi:MAG: hypothetical protein ACTSQP_13505 [Promethearchaeota archaeon]